MASPRKVNRFTVYVWTRNPPPPPPPWGEGGEGGRPEGGGLVPELKYFHMKTQPYTPGMGHAFRAKGGRERERDEDMEIYAFKC